MEQTPHNLLAGGDADQFAVEQGMQTGELLTSAAKKQWEQWRSSEASSNPIANIEEIRAENHDTIGVLALDRQGTVAAGCSTSGLSWKLPGRVGDSPIIGQGLYTDPALGACVCTGHGELVAGICGAFLAIEILRRGGSPEDACAEVMNRLTKSYRLHEQDQVGVIVLARSGKFATASLRQGYKTAIRTADREEIIEPGLVVYK
jgi:isoaspartyl peptidase/L-asparaginase-like protein (Ntn-hydrolase superfamily)